MTEVRLGGGKHGGRVVVAAGGDVIGDHVNCWVDDVAKTQASDRPTGRAG